jgi:hypothetical protein
VRELQDLYYSSVLRWTVRDKRFVVSSGGLCWAVGD